MSFNALSLAKIGIGFGVLAVAGIGLLSPIGDQDVTSLPHNTSIALTREYAQTWEGYFQVLDTDEENSVASALPLVVEVGHVIRVTERSPIGLPESTIPQAPATLPARVYNVRRKL